MTSKLNKVISKHKSFLKWLMLVVLVVCCNLFVVRLAIVFGQSMEPTLQQYEFVVVWQLGYVPESGDIVVTTADNEVGQSVIKRVAATEGQKVSYEQDGEVVELIVPQGQVFLLGDNQPQSMDSRELGCFAVEDIKGHVVARIFPFNKLTVF